MRNICALFSALIFTAAIAAGTACAQNSTIQFPRTGSIGTAPAASVPPAITASPYGSSVPTYGGTGPISITVDHFMRAKESRRRIPDNRVEKVNYVHPPADMMTAGEGRTNTDKASDRG